MRRAATAGALLAAAAGAAGTAAASTPGTAARLPSTAVGVGEREFRIALYRRVVPPGDVRLNLRNYGEDTHDLAVLTARGTTVATSGEVKAGARAALRVRLLRTGTYTVICTLSNHAARGMRTTLVVRRLAARGTG
ncbi:MAG: hypothetical protein U0R70_17595 [Solirubrobacteraceae bacterium]